MFSSIDDVIQRFSAQQYITNRNIATVVYLAAEMKKPILVEGPAGVGKTELAKVLAAAVGHQLIRLQCYEGLDEAKALYEWEYAKQLLYTQILKWGTRPRSARPSTASRVKTTSSSATASSCRGLCCKRSARRSPACS